MSRADLCRQLIARHADDLIMAPLRKGAPPLSAADGYLPLLVDFTHEDKEAKGLRKLADPALVRPPIHFSALEAVAQHEAVLILGAAGAGKTRFALDLALNLAGEHLGDRRFNLARLQRDLPRNDLGDRDVELWPGPAPTPVYLEAEAEQDLDGLLAGLAPLLNAPDQGPVLLILDGADRLGERGPRVLEALSRLAEAEGQVRLLVLGRTEVCSPWALPDRFASHMLLPLLRAQRAEYQAAHPSEAQAPPATLPWPDRPDLFILSMELGEAPEPDWRLVDRWLERAVDGPDAAARLRAWTFERAKQSAHDPLPSNIMPRLGDAAGPRLATTLEPFLLAQGLDGLEMQALSALFQAAPAVWARPLQILARRRTDEGQSAAPLIRMLVGAGGDAGAWGALVAAEILSEMGAASEGAPIVIAALADLIAQGRLTPIQRRAAGAHLARLGDPRDLEALIDIGPGAFTMGSASHANSSPVHILPVQGFRIGRYPVTNWAYRRFVQATGRTWRTADGQAPDRANVPATDLTWRDARAYCDWVTDVWRAEGRISPSERARLPTEPEWEYAARGSDPDSATEREGIVYPWRGPWASDHANSSETGFNAPCTVGLFPKGRTSSGLDDMSGQVWEWTTTLWGEDMATPRYAYPYVDDGRESLDAGPAVRRVLRGGCFSSGKQKACCTYRGSLEPDGFWRGNGFRIVVSRED